VQVKLLRVLQEREFERVGSAETVSVDIRLIAATNTSLQGMVEAGTFREDLYYRLKVVTLEVPPLRKRLDDIPQLVGAFVRRFCQENGMERLSVSPDVMKLLQQYSWPGNIRELQGVVESMVILAQGKSLDVENVPYEIRMKCDPEQVPINTGDATLAEIEKKVILQSLDKYNGNRTQTAEALGIGRRTLIRKLHEYGVSKDKDSDSDE
jgi:DNA-binding NtrC family response regulator